MRDHDDSVTRPATAGKGAVSADRALDKGSPPAAKRAERKRMIARLMAEAGVKPSQLAAALARPLRYVQKCLEPHEPAHFGIEDYADLDRELRGALMREDAALSGMALHPLGHEPVERAHLYDHFAATGREVTEYQAALLAAAHEGRPSTATARRVRREALDVLAAVGADLAAVEAQRIKPVAR